MSNQQTGLKPLAEILSLSPALKPSNRVSWWVWRDVVGERVAVRSAPDRLEGVVLLVTVQGSAWAQELSLLAPLILQGLRGRGLQVDTLRFRVGTLQIPDRPKPRRLPQSHPLPDSLQRSLQRLAHDPKLQAIISEAASLRWPRERQ